MILHSKTYAYSGMVTGFAQWIERSLGLAGLFSTLTGSVKIDSKARIKWRLKYPVPPPESPAGCCPTGTQPVADVAIDVRFDTTLAQADREELLARLQDLVLTTQFVNSIKFLEQPAS